MNYQQFEDWLNNAIIESNGGNEWLCESQDRETGATVDVDKWAILHQDGLDTITDKQKKMMFDRIHEVKMSIGLGMDDYRDDGLPENNFNFIP
jgi:hypothetical protein